MTGRNNEPDRNGPAGHPGRLDQFGDALASRNEAEFEAAAEAAEQACETDAVDSAAERGDAPRL